MRDLIPAAARYAYFDHAAKGPLPTPAADALRAYADDVAEHGGRHWPRWFGQIAEVRRRIANLIGGEPGEVALLNNTAAAIGTVAEGLDWREGDNVVVMADEFPSNLLPWRHLRTRGVEVREVPAPDGVVDMQEVQTRVDRRTRLIACSWVGWGTGYRIDIPELCSVAEGCNARILIDGIQAVGVQTLDVSQTPIDFLAGECRKWLLGPEGVGYLWVRQDRVEGLRPTRVGWASMDREDPFATDGMRFHADARRFENGMQPFALLAAVNASLGVLEATPPAGAARILGELRPQVVEAFEAAGGRVDSVGGKHASAIVAASFEGRDLEAMRKSLAERDVIVSVRCGRLRASPHVYTSAEDVRRLATGLRTV